MNVLITGASKGIGKAIAEIYSTNGYNIECPTHEELDLSDANSIKRYVEKKKDFSLDAIVNNAGINEITELENATDEQINSMYTVDLIGPTLLLRGAIPRLKKSKSGRIVNIGSIWAVVSKTGRSLYSASKNGLHGITNALAIELAPNNILVNTVCPGFTLTDLTRKNNTSEQIEQICKNIPLNRMANPDEIAKIVYFLGSTDNTYITGQKIIIDGGFTIQ